MTLRAVIVDDEPLGRQTVRNQCIAAGDIQVVGETSSGEEAIRLIRTLRPDVAFLDIHMRPVSGLQVAASIGKADMPVVVFVTAYDQYAVAAFELNAVDYLLKPFDALRFRNMLERVRRRIGPALSDATRQEIYRDAMSAANQISGCDSDVNEQPLILEIGERVYLFRKPEIESIEANGNYVTIWVRGQSYSVRGTLTDLEQQLAPPRFLRVRRSVLVNTAHIRHMEKWAHGEYLIEMNDGRKVTSGRTYRHRLNGIVLRKRGVDE